MFVIRISTYLLCKSWSSCKGSIHLVGVFAATAWEYCNSKFGCCVAESATHSQTIAFLESDLCSSKKPMSSKSRHARRFSMLKFIRKSGKGVLRTTLKLGMSIPYIWHCETIDIFAAASFVLYQEIPQHTRFPYKVNSYDERDKILVSGRNFSIFDLEF